jgi:hypothetical protein
MCKNLDSPSPKDGIRRTRIMSPLSHPWERGWACGKRFKQNWDAPIVQVLMDGLQG